ncbi:MAG TPA: hypothetical protein VK636_09250 [Gemmatimonadaceae bacterium]|nr:hypothetical protein [Gemmatimonadaceae bacterium]
MSDDKIKEKTGCTWEKWVRSLDHYGAATMSHGEIAELVKTKYKTPSWWTQTVTVGYERIKGLRTRGRQRNGTFGITRSRTYTVPVGELFDAWANESIRKHWLDGTVKVRTATAPKSIRLDWGDGGIIAVGFVAKGASKSSVALEHAKLPDRETADRFKAYWSEQLDTLGRTLRLCIAIVAEGVARDGSSLATPLRRRARILDTRVPSSRPCGTRRASTRHRERRDRFETSCDPCQRSRTFFRSP